MIMDQTENRPHNDIRARLAMSKETGIPEDGC